MPVNPNIAMGVRGIELQNPLAQYGQIAAIQNAQNQNALAQFQLTGAQREQESINALNQAYQSAYNPQTGEIDINALRKTLSTGGFGSKLPGLEKSLGELQKQKLETEKLKGEVTAQPTKLAAEQTNLVDAKLKQSRQFLENVTTPEQYIAWHESNHKDPILGPMLAARGVTADQARGRIMQAIQQGPAAFAQLINESKLGTEKFMELNKPQLSTKDIGGQIIDRTFEPLTGKLTELSRITKTPTISDITGQGQLNLARQKFAFEQANPGMTIQEDASGLLAVNNRTGVAIPVVYGQAGFQPAPATAPAAAGPSIMRQQGAGMPGQRMPAIPGMSSVLDQTTALTAPMPKPSAEGMRVAGQPVGSKKEAPVKFNDTDMQLAGLAGSLKDFKEEVGKNLFTGAKYIPSGADTSRMTAKYTALLMGVKDLYTLGALTGPDMSIIESQLTNPASWSGKFKTKEGFNEQVKVIEDMLKRSTTNLETTYGRVPKASRKAIETMSTGADAGVDTSNPLLR